jgi:alpha-mannosidase
LSLEPLQHLRQCLLPYSDRIREHTVYLLGHAHLDLAWLWTVEETWQVAERTFQSVLQLQQDFPELIFCHTTPALYEWMEQHRPELFAQIQQQVDAGRWEALGGLWVEPELNLIGAEAIARQLLYGQRYYQAKFGQLSRIAWLPDTFGFCGQLPQLFQQAGIDYFVTQKLRWNDTTKYPHELFAWQAPDGSQVLSLMSGPIGEGIDPVQLTTYCWEWVQRTGQSHPLWLMGVGDHGGGPTRDMLQIARRWQRSPFCPQLQFTRAIDYLDGLRQTQADGYPIWQQDLYLEFHRGCYTTHADQKAFNRDCETALYAAELWSALATILTQQPYPQAELETAWKQVLWNQFHDILPGTSITPVYEQANRQWQAARSTALGLGQTAITAIAQHISLPTPPHPAAQLMAVFNDLNWPRSGLVTAVLPPEVGTEIQHWQVWPLADGAAPPAPIPSSRGCTDGQQQLQFLAQEIPPLGYRLFWAVPAEETVPQAAAPSVLAPGQEQLQMENALLQVTVDRRTGDLISLVDKRHQREVLQGPANQVQRFRDQGQYWDAWNIDPNYRSARLPLGDDPLTGAPCFSAQVIESEIRQQPVLGLQEIWVRDALCERLYQLQADSPILTLQIRLSGDERHVLTKVAFPLKLAADWVTYATAAGAIQRPTRPQTEAEAAQWEVPGLGWADLSQDGYGVSLLCDRRHGYSHGPHELALSLLRGPEFPDPETDKGMHQFTYALYPHGGDWRSAQTVRRAREFSQALQAVVLNPFTCHGTLPLTGSCLDLQADNLMLMALKRAEDDPEQWLLRCYECHGEATVVAGASDVGLELGERLDLLERAIEHPIEHIKPWQVATFRLLA